MKHKAGCVDRVWSEFLLLASQASLAPISQITDVRRIKTGASSCILWCLWSPRGTPYLASQAAAPASPVVEDQEMGYTWYTQGKAQAPSPVVPT